LKNVDLLRANLCTADLYGANLCGANLRLAELNESNLSNANLSNAILEEVTFLGAKLDFANLAGADLCSSYIGGASLCGANLSKAKLNGAILTNTDLTGSILSGANLSFTNFSNAILSRVDFSNCILSNTIFGLTDLSTCTGLDSVEVSEPCTIDFQTLQASPNLLKSFLLKIGLPELYIDYLPDFFNLGGIRLFSAFISHSWANKPFARKLYEALIAKGVNVFFDEKKIKPGDKMYERISTGINCYDKTILVCSKDSLSSKWVDHEIELVLKKEMALAEERGKLFSLLIPIAIDDYIYQPTAEKYWEIRNRFIGDFRQWQDDSNFEKALIELIHALNVDRLDIKPPSFL